MNVEIMKINAFLLSVSCGTKIFTILLITIMVMIMPFTIMIMIVYIVKKRKEEKKVPITMVIRRQ